MKRIRRGTSSSLVFKRLFVFAVVTVIGMAAVYPLIDQPAADQMPENIDVSRWISYHKLMLDLKHRASRFRGEAGILIKDLKTNQTIDINSDKLFPSASLVKIPIMAAYFQAQEEGMLSLSDQLVLERRHKIRSCSHLYFARNGSRHSIRELIERMITESDNTATNMLTDRLGFGYLNQKFVEFGLKNTDLRRGIMDLKWRDAGIENYTTAEDMALLLEKIYNRTLVSPGASDEMLAVLKRQKVNDRIPRGLPNDLVVAHKTGLLRDTVSDVGVVFTPEGDFIICVLTADINNFRYAKRFIGNVAACAYDHCYRNMGNKI
jgi:beta-lactamase class A